MSSSEISYLIQTLNKGIVNDDNLEKKLSKTEDMFEWLDWLKDNKRISESEYHQYKQELHNMQGANGNLSAKTKVNKLHISIVFMAIIFVLSAGYFFYGRNNEVVVENGPTVLPFKGVLLNQEGHPITDKTDVEFKLYGSADDINALYIGKCQGENGIYPDHNGQFFITLGSDCNMDPLQRELFKEYTQLFLGVTIGESNELSQRYLIYTGPITNASTLNSLPIGTKKNTIAYIDDKNAVNFSDDDPVINSTSGILTLSGASLSLRSTSANVGNIELSPSINGSVLITGGNFGIGSLSPRYKLDIEDTEPNSSVASFSNLSKENLGSMNILNLGLGVDGSERTNFVVFYKNTEKNKDGEIVGSIELVDDRVVYNTSGADYAEYFETSEYIPPGYIVGIGPAGTRKAEIGDVPIGVVSNTAGFVGNNKARDNNSVLVGLVGQVKVLVTDTGGPIQPGDSIGMSDVNGVGTKATNGAVGYSLSNAQFSSSNCPQGLDSSIKCALVKVLLK